MGRAEENTGHDWEHKKPGAQGACVLGKPADDTNESQKA
jgi:hypothetical protein